MRPISEGLSVVEGEEKKTVDQECIERMRMILGTPSFFLILFPPLLLHHLLCPSFEEKMMVVRGL